MNHVLEIVVATPGCRTRCLRFDTLPVTFGRGPTCSILLDSPSVSRHHGSIEQLDGAVMLVDAGSANGIEHAGRRLRSRERVPLGSSPKTFILDGAMLTMRLMARACKHEAPPVPAPKPSRPAKYTTSLYEEARIDPAVEDRHAFARDALGAYARAREEAKTSLQSAFTSLDPTQRVALARVLSREFEELGHDAELAHLAADQGLSLCAEGTVEEAAARGVRALAVRFDVETPTSAANAVHFLETLGEVMHRLLEAYAALRMGYACDESAREPSGSTALGRMLLDWKNEAFEPAAWLETTSAELIAHHRQLVEETLDGMQRITQTLSPWAIDRGRRSMGWFRRRSYEAEHRERFAWVANHLSHGFGPRFAFAKAALERASLQSERPRSETRASPATALRPVEAAPMTVVEQA